MNEIIDKSVQILESGGIILYPTDTIWGIGCNAENEKSIKKIYKIKNRELNKPLIILVNNKEMLRKYVEKIPEKIEKILEQNTTPTTIIYPNPKKLPKILMKSKSIAIRITKDPLCLQIIKKLNKPIISTSANISKFPYPKNFREINMRIKKMVDYIVMLKINFNLEFPSSIVKINSKNEIQIIRK